MKGAICGPWNISSEGKARQKKQDALQAIADFRKSKALADAKDAVARQLAEWKKKNGIGIEATYSLRRGRAAR